MHRLLCFGGLSLVPSSGSAVTFSGQRKRLALLAMLAAAREQGLSRDRALLYLWPESDDDKARNALKQLVFGIRAELGPVISGAQNGVLRLDHAVIRCDIDDFRHAIAENNLEAAVGLYSGPFLDSFYLRGAPDFERWVEDERGRLRDQCAGCLESLAANAVAASDHRVAARWWKQRCELEPLNSRAAREYFLALAQSGERETALAYGRSYAALVRTELGSDPDPSFTTLLEEWQRRPSVPIAIVGGAVGGTSPLPMKVDRGIDTDAHQLTLTPTPSRPRRVMALAATAAVMSIPIVLAVAAAVTGPSPAIDDPAVVVVLPFENRTGEPRLDAVGLIAADRITDGVVHAALAPVVDAALTIRAAATPTDSPQLVLDSLARRTRAAYSVRGSYFRTGDSLQFEGRIVVAATGRVVTIPSVRAAVVDPLAGIEEMQQRLLGALARELDVRLGEMTDPRAPTPRYEAYEHYIRGLVAYTRDRDHVTAVAEFRRAYAADTSFVTALFWTYWPLNALKRTAEARALVDTLWARRATLTPLNRHALDVYRALDPFDLDAALVATGKAMNAAPRSEWAFKHAAYLLRANRPHETISILTQLDPQSGWLRNWPAYWTVLENAYHMVLDFEGMDSMTARVPSGNVVNVSQSSLTAAWRRALRDGATDSLYGYIAQLLLHDGPRASNDLAVLYREMMAHDRQRDADSVFTLYDAWYRGRGEPVDRALRLDRLLVLMAAQRFDLLERESTAIAAALRPPGKRLLHCGLAEARARRGDTTAAWVHIAAMDTARIGGMPMSSRRYCRARVYAAIGRRDDAMRQLVAIVPEFKWRNQQHHTFHYLFPELRGYPPFEEFAAVR